MDLLDFEIEFVIFRPTSRETEASMMDWSSRALTKATDDRTKD